MATPQKGRIFISYRRTDSAGYAGRIYDRLTAHFGVDTVFMDVDTIEAGVDFVEVLQKAVQSCDVLVALIGRNWLNIKDETGKRRLDNPEDFVRIEIAAALERDIRVIPVLVDGAPIPHSTELPDGLKSLARRNAMQVDHHSFNADAQRLISQLELALSTAEEERKQEVAKKAAIAARRLPMYTPPLTPRQYSPNLISKETQGERESKQAKSFLKQIRTPLFIIGGIVILFLLGYIIRNTFIPSTPSTPTENTSTFTVEPEPTATKTPEMLGVGSTMISEKDGMMMVYVPAGEFQMGSENGSSDEKPVHTVDLDAFWIDQTEVTNAMYARCVESGACDPPSSTGSYTHDRYYGNSEFDDYPVMYVSWNDAVAYCEWANRRLPTEAEWEKAARGTDERMYPWGNTIDNSYANYNSKIGDTTAVGSYEKGASFYGAYDMAGNVWEWVADWYDENYYSTSLSSNPMGPISGIFRVLRGGSCNVNDSSVRSADRYGVIPSDSSYGIGFRCARSP